MTHPSVNSIVERLRMWPAADGRDGLAGDYVENLMLDAATTISELQAEAERKDRLIQAHQQQIIDAGEIMKHWQARALTAESSLSRIKAETIEALQQIETVCIDNAGDTVRHDLALKFVGGIAAKAIRSLGSTGGAEKTAESGNPAPTRERE